MHQLFVTQIYQNRIKTTAEFDLKGLKKEVLQIEKADHQGREWSAKNYKNGYTSYGSWDQLHRLSSTFEDLRKKIDLHVARFSRSLDFDVKKNTLKMNSFWVNIMPPGTLHTSHIHPHSVISGTFYIDVPPGSSALKFEDPRLGLFMNAPLVKSAARKGNQRFYSLQPKAGDLVLFESWLKHEVPLNQSKKPRISASFNYSWS